jgi:hypothetical protein
MNNVMALDRSRHARAAIQLLQQMRWPAGSALTLLHVLEIVTISGGWQLHYHPELWKQFVGERQKLLAQAQRFLEHMEAQLQIGDTRVSKMVKWGSPLTGILETLKKTTGGPGCSWLSRAIRRKALLARKCERGRAPCRAVLRPDQSGTREGTS